MHFIIVPSCIALAEVALKSSEGPPRDVLPLRRAQELVAAVRQNSQAEESWDEDLSQPGDPQRNFKSNYAGLAGVFFKER